MDLDMVPDGPKHIPPYASRNKSSLGELLLGFLKYYATQFRYLPKSVEWFLSLLIFLLPFFISHSSRQLFLPLSPPFLLFLLPGFMFLTERQEQVRPLALHDIPWSPCLQYVYYHTKVKNQITFMVQTFCSATHLTQIIFSTISVIIL